MPPKPQAVRIKETGQIFKNAREVAEAIGGDYGSVYSCLRGSRKTHQGFTFEYVEGESEHEPA